MISRSRALSIVLVPLGVLLSACPDASEEQAPPTFLAAPPPVPEAAKPESTQLEAESEGELKEEDVIEIATGATDAKASKGGLANTPITPSPLEIRWEGRGSYEPGLRLLGLTSGVLGQRGELLLEPDREGRLAANPELPLPPGQLRGDWPKDAWAQLDTGLNTHQLWRFEDEQWLPYAHHGELRWTVPDQELRSSWHRGFLVREGQRIYRLGSPRDNPKVGPRMGKELLSIVETRSGRLYSLSLRKQSVYAQRDCQNFDCVEENAVKLPHGSGWSFTLQAPRQRHSVSLAAFVEREGARGSYLLHYEVGGWKLESMVGAPEGLWPSAKGGLWVLVQGALWYRDPGGLWFELPGPEGATVLSVAVSSEAERLWITTKAGAKVYAWTIPADPSTNTG